MTETAGDTAEDLLLVFRKVEEPDRRAAGRRLLDGGMRAPAWPVAGDLDLWELRDVASADDDGAVAVAATSTLGDGRRVRLLALVVAAGHRRHGIGRRMLEELGDALRARGVVTLVASVPAADAAAAVLVQRAGWRPSHVERRDGAADLVWFDVDL